jgi:hypothetical protein
MEKAIKVEGAALKTLEKHTEVGNRGKPVGFV